MFPIAELVLVTRLASILCPSEYPAYLTVARVSTSGYLTRRIFFSENNVFSPWSGQVHCLQVSFRSHRIGPFCSVGRTRSCSFETFSVSAVTTVSSSARSALRFLIALYSSPTASFAVLLKRSTRTQTKPETTRLDPDSLHTPPTSRSRHFISRF